MRPPLWLAQTMVSPAKLCRDLIPRPVLCNYLTPTPKPWAVLEGHSFVSTSCVVVPPFPPHLPTWALSSIRFQTVLLVLTCWLAYSCVFLLCVCPANSLLFSLSTLADYSLLPIHQEVLAKKKNYNAANSYGGSLALSLILVFSNVAFLFCFGLVWIGLGFETRFHYLAEAGLEFKIPLHWPFEFWNYSHGPSLLAWMANSIKGRELGV